MEELVAFSRDGEGEVLGSSTIFRDEVSFARWGEIESEFTFAEAVPGDDAPVGTGPNVSFVTRERVSSDHAVERVDGKGSFGLVFEHVVEALESARLIDLEGGTIFFEVATGDAGGFIQGGDIGRAAIVDPSFGAAENVQLVHVDSGAFGDLDAVDGFAASIEGCGAGASGRDGNELGFVD